MTFQHKQVYVYCFHSYPSWITIEVKTLVKYKVVKVVKCIRYTVSLIGYWLQKQKIGFICLSYAVLCCKIGLNF